MIVNRGHDGVISENKTGVEFNLFWLNRRRETPDDDKK